ncbi:MAG: O-antigen ligase family protein [Mesorhizobium sp.]
MKLWSCGGRLTIERVNMWFGGYVMTIPAMAGSLTTIAYYCVAIWALMNATVRRYTLQVPRRALPFIGSALFLFAVMCVTGLIADNSDRLPRAIMSLLPLALVAVVIARFRHAGSFETWQMALTYAPLGAAGALAGTLIAGSQSGGAGNPNVFGLAMTVLAAFSLAGIFGATRRDRLLGAAGYACAAAGVIVSDSRTMLVAVGILPLILLAASGGVRWRTIGLGAIGAAVLLVAFQSRIVSQLSTVIREIDLVDADVHSSSIGVRFKLWQAAWDAGLSSPFVGHGLQNKMQVVVDHIDDTLSWITFSHVHNAYLDAFVAGGFLGTLGLLMLFLSPLLMVFGFKDEARDRRFVAIALVATFLLQGTTANFLTHDLIVVLFALPLALVAACDPQTRDMILLRQREAVPAADTVAGAGSNQASSRAV